MSQRRLRWSSGSKCYGRPRIIQMPWSQADVGAVLAGPSPDETRDWKSASAPRRRRQRKHDRLIDEVTRKRDRHQHCQHWVDDRAWHRSHKKGRSGRRASNRRRRLPSVDLRVLCSRDSCSGWSVGKQARQEPFCQTWSRVFCDHAGCKKQIGKWKYITAQHHPSQRDGTRSAD